MVTAFILTLLGAYILYHFIDVIRITVNYFYRDKINRYYIKGNLSQAKTDILKNQFRYYKMLSSEEQTLFAKRVNKFIKMKEFIPRGQLREVTPEMKVLIAASAIQLTFGYPGIYFKHFWRIIVYEDNYYSTITQKFHQGEVNTRGFIILSWENFKLGYFHWDNGRNLGLHEMAHALKLENSIRNDEYNFIEHELLSRFYKLAKPEVEQIRSVGSSFFRHYGGQNVHEFFAVCIENFFERPEEFYQYNQELYITLTLLLKQDTRALNKNNATEMVRIKKTGQAGLI